MALAMSTTPSDCRIPPSFFRLKMRPRSCQRQYGSCMPRTSGGIRKTLETAAISVCDFVPSRNEQYIFGLFWLRSACSRYVSGVA